MATKFPKFSQDLAQDPTTRRIWYGIATGNDFESHDGMTEENLYQKIFATHFGHLAIIFLWASSLLTSVTWQSSSCGHPASCSRSLGNHLPVGIQPPVPRSLAR